jgi:hypothetical protein
VSKIICTVGVIVLAMVASAPLSAQNGNGIVCTPAPGLGVEPGNPGKVIQDLRDVLSDNPTPPEVAEFAEYESVGDAITTDCATPGRPRGNSD